MESTHPSVTKSQKSPAEIGLNAKASELLLPNCGCPFLEDKSMDFTTNVRRRKIPLCQKCNGHGIEVFLKSHRKECTFTECDCSACKLIESRNSIARSYYASLPCPVQGMVETTELKAKSSIILRTFSVMGTGNH